MKRRNITAAVAAMGMLVLILDGKTALTGASEGIGLCLRTLIPSLFPFFLLSILLTSSLSGETLPFLRPVTDACKIPDGAQSLLAIGFLGGYPVGAQNVAVLYRSGQISGRQAARLIACCNNAGPAFLFGILGPMFTAKTTPWLLWAVHIASALLVTILLPGGTDTKAVQVPRRHIAITSALEQSVKVMALVCGWVVLMRMVIAFLERWFLWLLPVAVQAAICGILELSNGCIRLSQIEQEGLRFILAGGLLSLGGLCVTLQTASVTDGISMRLYFPGKVLQCCISVLLCCVLQPVFPAAARCEFFIPMLFAGAAAILCLMFLRYSEKSCGIPVLSGV